jgi:hypothetical protein
MANARILAATGVLVALALAAPAAAVAPAALRVRAFQPLVVDGARFKPFERVTVTVERTWVRHVRAGADGGFTTTFRGILISRCDGLSAAAAGSRGSHAALNMRPLACPTVNPGQD